MMENKNHRLSELVRDNRGKKIRSTFLRDLSMSCGVEVDEIHFLNVEDTQSLKAEFIEKVKSSVGTFHDHWPKQDWMKLASTLENLATSLGDQSVVLFSNVDQYIGAVRIQARYVLLHPEATWRVVGEDLSIRSDHDGGLCLEENFYTRCGEYLREGVYEVTAWGNLRPSI
jgi:hypothetical protein